MCPRHKSKTIVCGTGCRTFFLAAANFCALASCVSSGMSFGVSSGTFATPGVSSVRKASQQM